MSEQLKPIPLRVPTSKGNIEVLLLNTSEFFTYKYGPQAGKTFLRPLIVVSMRFEGGNDTTDVVFGESMCSPGDRYNRARGVSIAFGRAIKELGFENPERKQLTEAFTQADGGARFLINLGMTPENMPELLSWYQDDEDSEALVRSAIEYDVKILVEIDEDGNETVTEFSL
jgi:hypothetical protein